MYVFLNNLAINGKMVDVVSALACVAFYSVTIYDLMKPPPIHCNFSNEREYLSQDITRFNKEYRFVNKLKQAGHMMLHYSSRVQGLIQD